MKIAIFSANKFEKEHLLLANTENHELVFIETYLNVKTYKLAEGCKCVSLFVNDDASSEVLEKLKEIGVLYIALRSAGYNHVDLPKAKQLQIKVANVPAYSPYAVAEHTVALMMALNRKLIQANHRVKDLNFSLDGLTGFDFNGKTVGIIGLGKIGSIVAKIMHGLGCKSLGFDKDQDSTLIDKFNLNYATIDQICAESDIITLHIPLNEETKYIIDFEQVSKMKKGIMLINTSRGGLINTKEIIQALKSGHIGYLGLDVYEEEKGLFFEDHSNSILQDDVIARLLTFKNVLITSHQAFLTTTALTNISETTFLTINKWASGKASPFEL